MIVFLTVCNLLCLSALTFDSGLFSKHW